MLQVASIAYYLQTLSTHRITPFLIDMCMLQMLLSCVAILSANEPFFQLSS
jgi:hypothetical protein